MIIPRIRIFCICIGLFIAAVDEAVEPAAFVTNVEMTNGQVRLTIQSELGLTNEIQRIADMTQTNWSTFTNLLVQQSPYEVIDPTVTNPPAASRQFYRVVAFLTNLPGPVAPSNMVSIPNGSFVRGDTLGESFDGDESPTNTISVSPFLMDKFEVSKIVWDEVHDWATNNEYLFSGSAAAEAPDHPLHSLTWHDAVKWCNARSEKESRTPAYYTEAGQTNVYRTGVVDVENDWVKWNEGYRLPTEAEWERAARGGSETNRFTWSTSNTISHALANFFSPTVAPPLYDVSNPRGYHPIYDDGTAPYTSPVGSFATNDFGLHNMTGNVWEWCWDRYGSSYYTNATTVDPKGPTTGGFRSNRGASWGSSSLDCRVSNRTRDDPAFGSDVLGFRTVLPAVGP